MHNLVLKIASQIISSDYKHFKEKYVGRDSNYEDNIFGHLVANFRNRKHLFLHSSRMTNNGNRCPIYELSKMLVNELK